MVTTSVSQLIHVQSGHAQLEGMLELPEVLLGMALFAHGSGSSRLSPRNNYVAAELRKAGLGTLLIDLLTNEEDENYEARFDIPLLTRRLIHATRWLQSAEQTRKLPIGYFGASTGAAAAMQAAAELGPDIAAVVSRGGRPDLAGTEALSRVKAPTLLIVGGFDEVVIALNEQAYGRLTCPKDMIIIPGATHLFEEPGTLEQVALHASVWFRKCLGRRA